MKTVGQLLKQARTRQNLSLEAVADITKIRLDYLQAIESDQFHRLPSATFVKGFIQNYAKSVGLDPAITLAVFRRDFDQNQQGKIIPRGLTNPLKTPSRFWNPRTTTLSLAFVLILLLAFYAISQLLTLTGAPQLSLTYPQEGETLTPLVDVSGKTTTDATVTVNQTPVSLSLDGSFQTTLNLSPGHHTIIITASSREGKTRTLTRSVLVEPAN